MIMCKCLFEAEKCHKFCITLSGEFFSKTWLFQTLPVPNYLLVSVNYNYVIYINNQCQLTQYLCMAAFKIASVAKRNTESFPTITKSNRYTAQ